MRAPHTLGFYDIAGFQIYWQLFFFLRIFQ